MCDDVATAMMRLLERYPTLCDAGFGISNFNPQAPTRRKRQTLNELRLSLCLGIREVETAIAFLSHCRPTKMPTRHSYGLKHCAERWGERHGLEPYVSSGALITAALILGLPVKPDDPRSLQLRWLGCVSPNARVGVGQRDPE